MQTKNTVDFNKIIEIVNSEDDKTYRLQLINTQLSKYNTELLVGDSYRFLLQNKEQNNSKEKEKWLEALCTS